MTYEDIMARVRTVPEDRLEELNSLIENYIDSHIEDEYSEEERREAFRRLESLRKPSDRLIDCKEELLKIKEELNDYKEVLSISDRLIDQNANVYKALAK